MEIEQRFRDAYANDPVLNAYEQVERSGGEIAEALEENLKAAGYSQREVETALYGAEALKEQGLEPAPIGKLEAALEAARTCSRTWQQWIDQRKLEELPKPSTVANWRSRLTMLARWLGRNYFGGITKEQAVDYKSVLRGRNTHQSFRTSINTLMAFWNHAKDHGQVKENIWDGRTRKIAPSPKSEVIKTEVMDAARAKADERKDIQFFIQIYTGCRKGEHGGLRWCDINTDDRTIRFEEWEVGRIKRYLKGGQKDERTVPICSKLMDKLKLYLPDAFTNNSSEAIWPEDYKEINAAWASKWAERFSDNYTFSSHNLRSYVVSQLMGARLSPFHLYEITRHSIPGMSQVVSGYVRPTLDEMREIVEELQ